MYSSLTLQTKPKKEDPMSLEEAVDDSENLTDFLMDFEEDEWEPSTALNFYGLHTIWFLGSESESSKWML